MPSSHTNDKAHKEIEDKISKSRATKEEVRKATKHSVEQYLEVLKELAKR
jgi:hypothetical protein